MLGVHTAKGCEGGRNSEEREVAVRETRVGMREVKKRVFVVELSAGNQLGMDERSNVLMEKQRGSTPTADEDHACGAANTG